MKEEEKREAPPSEEELRQLVGLGRSLPCLSPFITFEEGAEEGKQLHPGVSYMGDLIINKKRVR